MHDTESFIAKAQKIHGSAYGYDKVNYVRGVVPVSIYCTRCNRYFEQKPVNHLNKRGCTYCKYEYGRKTKQDFIKDAISKHGNRYDYSNVQYINTHTEVEIRCNQCKKSNWQKPVDHLRRNLACWCQRSSGEIRIAAILDELAIEYEREKVFKDCVCRGPLRFDFYLPKLNMCIEYDGAYHFKKKPYKDCDDLEHQRNRDEIKNRYCVANGIVLLRIPHTKTNIREIIEHSVYNRV